MTCVNISGFESAREAMEVGLQRRCRRSMGASSGGERMWRIWREFGFIELSQRCTVPPEFTKFINGLRMGPECECVQALSWS